MLVKSLYTSCPEGRRSGCGRATAREPTEAGEKDHIHLAAVPTHSEAGPCSKDTCIYTVTVALYSALPRRLRLTRSSHQQRGCNSAVCPPPVAHPLEVELGAEGVERAVVPKLRERGLQALRGGGGRPHTTKTTNNFRVNGVYSKLGTLTALGPYSRAVFRSIGPA